MYRRSLLITLASLLVTRADGGVVVDTNIAFQSQPAGPNRWLVNLNIIETGTIPFPDYTCFSFYWEGDSATPFLSCLDGGSDYFIAEEGDAFTIAAIQSAQFTSFFEDSVHIDESEVFYVGVITPHTSVIESNSIIAYGWMKLENTPDGLEMLENVMAYDVGGVIIGTTETVPEPSTIALSIPGIFALFGQRFARMNSIVH